MLYVMVNDFARYRCPRRPGMVVSLNGTAASPVPRSGIDPAAAKGEPVYAMRPAGWLRDTQVESARDETASRPAEAPEETLGRPRWCCIACGLIITDREQSRLVAGRHVHRCTNPAGLTFEIGCFREAPGCAAVGEPTLEWTWFAGCRWQVALCRQCGLHLGWRYTGDDVFFGLILDRLVECGEKVS